MQYITYEMFGAAGDGVTNDMPAIAKAHAAANEKNLPVRAKQGAVYYISPADQTAVVKTSADWTGARFIVDDVGCENHQSPVFLVKSRMEKIPFALKTLKKGQTVIPNPTGRKLHLVFYNENHKDYIRRGLNRSNGESRRDNALLLEDGSLTSPVSFDFEEITAVDAYPVDEELLTLRGGEFTTIANRAESQYNYHARNIEIRRSRVEISHIRHYVQGEGEQGAPYRGFVSVLHSAMVSIHDCLFTGHKTYWTIGSANLPVPMGSYDINLNASTQVTLQRCSQTNDIMDRTYWGLIGTNFCRELMLEDCAFSRFDAHCGVTGCTIRRCRLGHQCLNAIGFGDFVIEDTQACGNALVTLREDYGSTWQGRMFIRNCVWKPLGSERSVFNARNDGSHDFGYECHLPREVEIDGLEIVENQLAKPEEPVSIFNDYLRDMDEPVKERPYAPVKPEKVKVKNIHTSRTLQLCRRPELLLGTEFVAQ